MRPMRWKSARFRTRKAAKLPVHSRRDFVCASTGDELPRAKPQACGDTLRQARKQLQRESLASLPTMKCSDRLQRSVTTLPILRASSRGAHMDRDDGAGGRRRALQEISGGLLLAVTGSAFAQQETSSNAQGGAISLGHRDLREGSGEAAMGRAGQPDRTLRRTSRKLRRICDGKNDQ
jgi:hypothetical protein